MIPRSHFFYISKPQFSHLRKGTKHNIESPSFERLAWRQHGVIYGGRCVCGCLQRWVLTASSSLHRAPLLPLGWGLFLSPWIQLTCDLVWPIECGRSNPVTFWGELWGKRSRFGGKRSRFTFMSTMGESHLVYKRKKTHGGECRT